MAELVIKISEEKLSIIKNKMYCGIYDPDLYKAIENGIVLPKGHGVLKDTDAICKDIISALGIRDENYLLEAEKAVYKRIKSAQTIIEADQEE